MYFRPVTFSDWDEVQAWNKKQGGDPLSEDLTYVMFYKPLPGGEKEIRGIFGYGQVKFCAVGVAKDASPTESAKIVRAIDIHLGMLGAKPTLCLVHTTSPMYKLAQRVMLAKPECTPMLFYREGRI